jgi:hypothetical protein
VNSLGKYSLSQKIGIITLLLYGIDFLFDGKISSSLILNTSMVIYNFEFWRLFSFPFAHSGSESIFLMAFALIYVSPKVELSIRNRFYHLILFLLVCLEGTIFALFYHSQFSILAGATGISFFIMSIFIMLNLNKNFMAYRKKPVRIILMISAAALTWVSVISLRALLIGTEPAYTELASAGFGIVSASLIYIQIVLLDQRKRYRLKTGNQLQAIPEPEEYTHAYASGAEQRRFRNSEIDDYQMYEPENDLSEDRLNEILDKINEYGKESLSPDEIRFLKEYSKSL